MRDCYDRGAFWSASDRLRQERQLHDQEMAQRERQHREVLREMRRADMTAEERTFEERVNRAKRDIDHARECLADAMLSADSLFMRGADAALRQEYEDMRHEAATRAQDAFRDRMVALRQLLANPPAGSQITEWLVP